MTRQSRKARLAHARSATRRRRLSAVRSLFAARSSVPLFSYAGIRSTCGLRPRRVRDVLRVVRRVVEYDEKAAAEQHEEDGGGYPTEDGHFRPGFEPGHCRVPSSLL